MEAEIQPKKAQCSPTKVPWINDRSQQNLLHL